MTGTRLAFAEPSLTAARLTSRRWLAIRHGRRGRVGLAFLALACLTSQAAAQRGEPEPPSAAIVNRAPLDGRSDVGFYAMVAPETVFVGQQATYQVGVFLSEEVRARLRRNPQFQPPEVRSTLAFDLPSFPGQLTRSVGSRTYDAHVFQRALFPLTPGTHVIPSARLDYALPLSNSFFAREENHSVRSGAVALVAVPPPMAGRPTDYKGAVGRLSISARMDRRQARVGDPLTFTVRVDGVGNVTLLPRPELRIPWGDVVPSGERVELDSSAMLLRGRKDFDWIVTPRQAGTNAFPRVRYPYFNPYTERYEIALTRAESITVADGAIAPRPDVADVRAVPIRRHYRGEVPAPLSSHGGYWFVLAIAPLPAAVLAMRRRPERPRTTSPAQALEAIASRPVVDAPVLRRAYAAAMAARVHVTAAQMSDHAILVRTLRRAGVSAETAAAADRMLAELDAIVYGRVGHLKSDAARRALDIVRAIDAEARTPASLAARARALAPAVLLLLATGVVTAWAAVQDATAQRVFADGVAAYEARRFDEARQAFIELAEARPRAVDAWVNVGSASWELGDTAAAAIGWQRAVRLEPTAGDIRDLLTLTPGYRDGWLGDVPPISLQGLAVMGALAWLLGWMIIAIALHRSGRPLPLGRGDDAVVVKLRVQHGAVPLLVAGLIALTGVWQAETVSGKDAAVVVSPTRVRAMPILAAEEGAATVTGEVVRILGEQGVWTLVRTSDGRRGWLESRRLVTVAVE